MIYWNLPTKVLVVSVYVMLCVPSGAESVQVVTRRENLGARLGYNASLVLDAGGLESVLTIMPRNPGNFPPRGAFPGSPGTPGNHPGGAGAGGGGRGGRGNNFARCTGRRGGRNGSGSGRGKWDPQT